MFPLIKKDIPLAPYTTLGVGGHAEYFTQVTNLHELHEVVLWAKENVIPITIIGGGSNVLISDDGVEGMVVRIQFTDITYTQKNDSFTYVTVGAGVVLDALIADLVSRKLWGLENLSAIPGTVGAVPIQNVGAYGVEAGECIDTVTAYDTETNTIVELTNEACLFSYRDSLFKHTEGKRYIVIVVTFVVSNTPNPKLGYKDIKSFFGKYTPSDIGDIRKAIIAIRSKKFPDWRNVGTAGSFFKNPMISQVQFEALKILYPLIPGYVVKGNQVKISLGWVLDHVCSMRGFKKGTVGLYEHQALVLVCEKGSSATEVQNFAAYVIEQVFQKTKISIEREVTFLK